MKKVKNPFVIGTYIGGEYFCDRAEEVEILRKHMDNGRNVALSAPRRLGKTGLIHHFFHDESIRSEYFTFFIDLYSTNSLAEMVQMLALEVYRQLQPVTDHWWERFATVISSLSVGISADPLTGQPSFNIGLGQIHAPETSLEQIFQYLETAPRPCIVAIDEFQQIANYEEKNVEALLRTRIQRCSNTHFIYAGSKRHMMTQMFTSPSRPFYQSCINMTLEPIPFDIYADFCQLHFERNGRHIERGVVELVYHDFEGFTWYMHMLLNELYALTEEGETCNETAYPTAIRNVVLSQQSAYNSLLAFIPPKQKMVLEAICSEGCAQNVTSAAFIRRHALPSTSSVQSALKGLVEKDIIVSVDGSYHISDYFLDRYLREYRNLVAI